MSSGESGHDYTYNFVLIGTLIAADVEFILVPTFGHLSDTIGRKKIYAWGAAIMGVWGFIYFAMLDNGVSWLAFVALCLGLVPHAMHYGPQASIIAGGPAALIATWLIHQFGTGYAVSVYMLVSAVITLIALKFLADCSRSDITKDETYEQRASR